MKPELKALGANLLKLTYGKLLSRYDFNVSLRRYTMGELFQTTTSFRAREVDRENSASGRGKAVQVDPIESTLKAHGSISLKLENGKLLSNFGFNFNLRRYTEGRAGR